MAEEYILVNAGEQIQIDPVGADKGTKAEHSEAVLCREYKKVELHKIAIKQIPRT